MSTFTVDLSAAIANKLRGVSGLQDVYEYETDKPTNGRYPFAAVTQGHFEGKFGDTIRNIRTYEFNIRVYQERTAAAFGNDKAERLIREMTDEILTAFDSDTTLSGMVKYVRPARGDLNYVEREVGDTRVVEVTLECVGVVPSIT